MATYTLEVAIPDEHVVQFNEQGYKLCFAAGVTTKTGGDPTYNVVACTKESANNVTITWTERYAIGATDSTFSNGNKFNAATYEVPIRFGQTYTQPSDLNDGSIGEGGPESGFKFVNKASAAAAVVYKKVEGAWSPIYINKWSPLPQGTETLIPVLSVAIWFANDAATANMISTFSGEALTIDLTQNQSHTASVEYTADGQWNVLSNQ